MPVEYIAKGAELSLDGVYQYQLSREWRGPHDRSNWYWFDTKTDDGVEWGEPKSCVFVMLNPSTADGEIDDPTIRKCVGFARLWKYEKLVVVNLFAFRATNPAELFRAEEPVGWRNQQYVEHAIHRAGIIVCAWGNTGYYLGQDQTMLGWIDKANINNAHVVALKINKATGRPAHPLYMPYPPNIVDFGAL